MAPAFHHGRAVVHARGHRRAEADRRARRPARRRNDELLLRRLAPFLLAGLHVAAARSRPTSTRDRSTRRSTRTHCSRTLKRWRCRCSLCSGSSLRSPSLIALAYVNASRRRVWTATIAALLARRVDVCACCPLGSTLVLGAAFVLARARRCWCPSLRRKLDQRRRAARVPQGDAADVADRARGARGRHRVVGRRAVLRQARLAQAARRARARR